MFGDEVSFDGIELPTKELIKDLDGTKNLKSLQKKYIKKIFSKKLLFLFVISIFTISAIFGDSSLSFDINDYNFDVIQSVGLPGGKLAADDNTATIPYDKATNGEVDLEYTITVPKTTRKKSYEICILLPADISPYISSKDIQGEVMELKNNIEKETFDKCEYLIEDVENVSDYYICIINIDSGKLKSTNKIELTLNIPSYYKNKNITCNIFSHVFVDRRIHRNREENFPKKQYSLKIR